MLARFVQLLMLVLVAGPASAARPTLQECREAGDFVRNAALSRDNGMPRQAFLERLQADLIGIRSYPPEVRWFAKDESDEAFLIAAVESVFDMPRKSTEHESDMLRMCLARMDGRFASRGKRM
jgi:hypothetical protein